MSSILKALQKLDNDKAARQTKEPDISRAIVRDKLRPSRRTAWLIPFAMVAIAAASILLTFTLMGGFSPHRQPPSPASNQTASSRLSTGVTPVVPANPASSNALPANIPAAQVSDVPSNKTTIKPVTKKEIIVPVPLSTPALPPAKSYQETSASEVTNHIQSRTASVPAFRVSGIAWQKDSASRLAVVNGHPVTEGGTVDGAKVEQIFPDHVRFTLGGKTVEAYMDRDGRD